MDLQRMRFAAAYTAQNSTGVSILVALSILSLIAILGLLFAVALSVWNTRTREGPLFVRTHISAYFLSLLLCWVIQCVGSILNVEWLRTKTVQLGGVCIAQGVLKHIADVGIAFWTFAIAAHTFACLFLNLKLSRYVLAIVLSFGWIFISLIVASGPVFLDTKRRGSFYDVSEYSCWISPEYKLQSITLGYMIMFSSAFFSAVLCILTFRLRAGYVSDNHTMLVAKQMLLYPLTYAILVMPTAVTRFIVWSGTSVGFEWVVFGASLYMMSGFINVILFMTTSRMLPLSSLRIGNWYLVPSSGGSFEGQAEKGVARVVSFAPESTAARRPTIGRQTKRPLEIAIPNYRDSCSDMYTAREGVFMPPALSSHWSPETPPLPGRLSIAFQNISAIAHKI